MSNQEKIDFLKQYKNLDNHIDILLAEAEKWKTRAEKITPVLTGMPAGGDNDNQRESAICKMIDCKWEATKETDELVDLGRKIKSAIKAVPNHDHRLLLTYRYISGMTFEEISFKMNYSWRQTHRMHSQALNEIEIMS